MKYFAILLIASLVLLSCVAVPTQSSTSTPTADTDATAVVEQPTEEPVEEPTAASAQVYQNEEGNYRIEVPKDFTITASSGVANETPISGPPHDEGGRETSGYLLIQVSPSDGRTTEDLAANTSMDEETTRSELSLAGEEAIMMDNKPGPVRNRQAFLIHNGLAYVFTLSPIDSEQYPEATADAERLWQSTVDSFSFIAP